MGKHHTYRKRGSVRGQTVSVLPPPAPILDVEDNGLTQTAQGDDDYGGRCNLWASSNGETSWVIAGQQPWISSCGWGPVAGQPPGYYRCTEIGNGSVYLGESAPSNILNLT